MRLRLPALLPVLLAGCAQLPWSAERTEPGTLALDVPSTDVQATMAHAVPATLSGDAGYPGFLQPAALVVTHDATTEPTAFEPPGDIWERIRRSYALPEQQHPRINTQLEWYARHPAYMKRVAERGRPYLFHIVETLEARGVPGEIALLPIVESAFHPFAYSHGRAAGIWQFIPSTGKSFGLEQNWWYDGRRDIYASTEAAIEYLDRLQKRFDGDWLLALAAYNSGGGTVSRAIRENRRRGKPTDFWHLDLPKETRAYVPKLLALKALIGDPQAFDLELEPIPDEPYFARVELDSQIDLALAAELAELELEQIYQLNPGFNRWATAPDGPHHLLLPLERAADFQERLAQVPPEQRISWQVHEVKTGETLGAIARRHGTTVATLQQANKLRGHVIRAGSKLLIPVASRKPSSYTLSAEQRLRQTQERERSGTKLVHIVRPGDTFWDLARRHGVSVSQLARWNAMAPRDPLMPNQRLVIWTKQGQQHTAPELPNQREITQKVGYVVRRGDSLYRISNRFNVTIDQLRRWNNLPRDGYLQPGQRLTVYVNVIGQNGG